MSGLFQNVKTAIAKAIGTLTITLAGSGGAGMLGFMPVGVGAIQRNVQIQLQKTVWLDDYDTLAHAIASLGVNGGVVNVPVGRFDAGDWNYNTQYMSTANITIRGVKMPGLSANGDRLEGGSIIYGRFNVFADNFAIENIGFDLGKYVCDTYFSGYDSHSSNYPRAGGTSTWDAFAFAQPNGSTPLAARKNFRAQNVIGLLRDPLSLGHAVLMEAFDGGFVDNVIGVYGVHGVVIKASNVRGGSIAGWMASTDNVIFKSDTYAAGGNINIASVEARTIAPNCTPWSTPSAAAYGLFVNPETASFNGPIQIGTLKVFGSTSAFYISGGSSYTANDIQIGRLIADGYTGSMTRAVGYTSARAMRVQIGELIGNSMTTGVEWNATTLGDNADHQLSIGSCKLSAIDLWAIRAENYGRIRIENLEVKTAGVAYLIDDNARIMVGKETLISVSDKWGAGYGKTAPSIGAGWSNTGGSYEVFEVKLENFGCRFTGTLSNSGSAGTIFANLPAYLRPVKAVIEAGCGFTSPSTYSAVPCVVNSAGQCATNEGVSTTGAGTRLSIDGINWQNW